VFTLTERLDAPIEAEAARLIQELEDALNEALAVVQAPGSHEAGRRRFNQAINRVNAMQIPRLDTVELLQQQQQGQGAQGIYNLVFPFHARPDPTHQLLGTQPRGANMDQLCLQDVIDDITAATEEYRLLGELQEALNDAVAAVQTPGDFDMEHQRENGLIMLNRAIGVLNEGNVPGLRRVPPVEQERQQGQQEPQQLNFQQPPLDAKRRFLDRQARACIRQAIRSFGAAAAEPTRRPRQLAAAWVDRNHGTGNREKRSSQPAKELGATLNIFDADPISDFVITKIEFKEMYGDQSETHLVDFERKAFIPDPNKSGGQIKTEFKVDDEVVPHTVEKNPVTTYKIVLKPRGT